MVSDNSLTPWFHQQVPHVVQQVMSEESRPILSGAIPAFKMFMMKWEKLAAEHAKLRPIVQPGLDWAYKYYSQMDETKAYVVAMCKQIIS